MLVGTEKDFLPGHVDPAARTRRTRAGVLDDTLHFEARRGDRETNGAPSIGATHSIGAGSVVAFYLAAPVAHPSLTASSAALGGRLTAKLLGSDDRACQPGLAR